MYKIQQVWPSEVIFAKPQLECKLCVAACPVGAISPDGDFQFSNCATHNYREFMSGFSDWVEKVAESNTALSYWESAVSWCLAGWGSSAEGRAR